MKNSEQPINPMPHQNQDGTIQHDVYFGLTKREYFAVKAMQGLLSNPEWMEEFKGEKYLMRSDIVAEVAIETADTILAKLSIEDGQ